MANDYNITVSYKLDTGDTAGKAAAAGQRDAQAYENAFKGSVDLTKALKPGDAGRQIGEQAGASLADAIGKSRVLVDRMRGEMLAKAFPQATAGAVPSAYPLLPPPSARGAPEDFARRIQPMLSGMEAFAMLLRGAPLLSLAQMAGQALTGLGRGVAPARPSGPAPYRFYGMPTGEAEAIRRAEEASGADRIAEIQARNRAAAAGEAAEGGMGGLVKKGLIVTAIAEIGKAAYDLSTALGSVGEKAVDASTETHDLADTLGISTEEFHKLEDRVARSGASIHDYGRALTRTAVTAKEQMPAIEHAIATSADVAEESNIRVRDSERAVAQARDNRRLATDKVSAAEGELIKVQETGAQQREEQRRAAELGLSGALIAQRGARMQLAQAGIQAQFAPEQQRLADIAGPLTVKGAELGVKGARISAEEAVAHLRALQGRPEDPDITQRRELRKAALAVEVARHNVEQAELHEQQADLAERQRQRMKAAGLGPVGQAQQQMLQAAQAAEEADLHVQQMATAKQRLEIDQQHNTLQMEENRAQAGLATARRGVGAAADEQTQAEIKLRQDQYAAEQERYNDIKTAQKFLRGGAGAMEPGFDPRRISAEAFRGAIFREAAGAPGGIPEALSKYLQTPGLDFREQQKRVLEIFPTLLRGDPSTRAEITRSLAKPPSEVSPEDQALRRRLSQREDLTREAAEELRATRAAGALKAEREAELTGLTPQALRAYADKQIIDRGLAVTEDFLTRRALGIPGEAFQPAEEKPPEQAKPETPASFAERFPALAKPEQSTEAPALAPLLGVRPGAPEGTRALPPLLSAATIGNTGGIRVEVTNPWCCDGGKPGDKDKKAPSAPAPPAPSAQPSGAPSAGGPTILGPGGGAAGQARSAGLPGPESGGGSGAPGTAPAPQQTTPGTGAKVPGKVWVPDGRGGGSWMAPGEEKVPGKVWVPDGRGGGSLVDKPQAALGQKPGPGTGGTDPNIPAGSHPEAQNVPRVVVPGQTVSPKGYDPTKPVTQGVPPAPSERGQRPEGEPGRLRFLIPGKQQRELQVTAAPPPPKPTTVDKPPLSEFPQNLPKVNLPEFGGPPGAITEPPVTPGRYPGWPDVPGVGIAIEPREKKKETISEGKAPKEQPAPNIKAPDLLSPGSAVRAPRGTQLQEIYGPFDPSSRSVPINVPPLEMGTREAPGGGGATLPEIKVTPPPTRPPTEFEKRFPGQEQFLPSRSELAPESRAAEVQRKVGLGATAGADITQLGPLPMDPLESGMQPKGMEPPHAPYVPPEETNLPLWSGAAAVVAAGHLLAGGGLYAYKRYRDAQQKAAEENRLRQEGIKKLKEKFNRFFTGDASDPSREFMRGTPASDPSREFMKGAPASDPSREFMKGQQLPTPPEETFPPESRPRTPPPEETFPPEPRPGPQTSIEDFFKKQAPPSPQPAGFAEGGSIDNLPLPPSDPRPAANVERAYKTYQADLDKEIAANRQAHIEAMGGQMAVDIGVESLRKLTHKMALARYGRRGEVPPFKPASGEAEEASTGEAMRTISSKINPDKFAKAVEQFRKSKNIEYAPAYTLMNRLSDFFTGMAEGGLIGGDDSGSGLVDKREDRKVAPGIYSPMAPGETVRKDAHGNRIYVQPERGGSPVGTKVKGTSGAPVFEDPVFQVPVFQVPAGFAEGGVVGGWGSGKSDSNVIRVSKGEYVVTADGSNLKDAIAHFTKGFANGGLVGGFADAIAHIPGYASGGQVRGTAADKGNSLGHHSLDIRTNAGNFTAHVSEDTMEAIRKSSLGGKLSQTGPRPTWYS